MSRPSLRGLVACSLLALIAGATPAGVASAAPAAGAGGAGDSYFSRDGNGGYDVAHYDIHDTYRIHRDRLRGWTRVTATATQDLSRFDLDLVLDASSVTVDGAPASFTKPNRHELVVTPAKPIKRNRTFQVTVRYAGRPGHLGYGRERPFLREGGEALATNEPHVAPWWFAANDHPSDKATFRVSIRVPRGNQVFGNGELVSRSYGDTWTTWTWRIDQRITTYLAYFAAGRYRWETGTTDGLPYWRAVSRRLPRADQDKAMRALRRTSAIVAWESGQFGAYPFTSTGGVVTGIYTGFALENASRPMYPWWGSVNGAVNVEVHELAHQWFGDSVSVSRWRDIWLNEGFASWVEWRYAEAHGGPTAQSRLRNGYRSYPADDPMWRVRLDDPGPQRMFDNAIYQRGAMALQALRHRIGRAAFGTLLRTWVQQHRDGNASVQEFEDLAGQVSGRDLSGFFDAWLHARSKPARTAANGLG